MRASTLSPRERLILNCVVDSHVKNANPIGSRYLSKRYNFGISAATIRNVMNDLEEMGYLRQPHVSAGRVPTDRGYRFYVDSLMPIPLLTRGDRKFIADNIDTASVDEDELFETSSQVLSKISSQLGVVLEPRFDQGIFQKMELVSVAHKKILAVITIKSGLVKTVTIEVDSEVNDSVLSETSWIVNERLSGLALDVIIDSIDERLTCNSATCNRLLKVIVRSSNKLFNFRDQENLYFSGTDYIMSNPEFSEREYALRILKLIESKQIVLQYFDEIEEDNISIKIGEENRQDMFRDYSIISAKYRIGNVTGTLGVVGPTRMHYAKIISLVDYMRKFLTQMLDGESIS